MAAVDEEVGGTVNSVEIEQDPFSRAAFRFELFAVVDDSVRQIGVLRPVRQCRIERLPDAPVVRQVDRRPPRIIQIGPFESGDVPRAEFPVVMERFAPVSHAVALRVSKKILRFPVHATPVGKKNRRFSKFPLAFEFVIAYNIYRD